MYSFDAGPLLWNNKSYLITNLQSNLLFLWYRSFDSLFIFVSLAKLSSLTSTSDFYRLLINMGQYSHSPLHKSTGVWDRDCSEDIYRLWQQGIWSEESSLSLWSNNESWEWVLIILLAIIVHWYITNHGQLSLIGKNRSRKQLLVSCHPTS